MDASSIILCLNLITIDGDTVKCDGENLRPMGAGAPHISGFDTPEIRNPECNAEARLAAKAMARFADLIETPGLVILDSGQRDTTPDKRRLVWLHLPSGETIGEVLIREGLARPWKPRQRNNWCE